MNRWLLTYRHDVIVDLIFSCDVTRWCSSSPRGNEMKKLWVTWADYVATMSDGNVDRKSRTETRIWSQDLLFGTLSRVIWTGRVRVTAFVCWFILAYITRKGAGGGSYGQQWIGRRVETVVAYFKIHTFAWNRHISQDGWRRAETLSGDARNTSLKCEAFIRQKFGEVVLFFIVTRIVNWHRWNETQRM